MPKKSAAKSKKKSKLAFGRQDVIVFSVVITAILFALWQILAAQVRVSHSDWPVYSNEEGQFSFRYPPEWGTPEQRQFDYPERPNYFYMAFPNQPRVSLGGSLEGYEHPGRVVAPTDDPGFLRGKDNQFYTPGNSSSSNMSIPANQLSLVEGADDTKCLYNYQEYSESYSAAFGIIRCNLPTRPFYGINFVITNPLQEDDDLALLYEVLSTFKKTAQ